MLAKLEDCQTLRHHDGCGRHTIGLITTDKSDLANMPMLAAVNAFIKILSALDTNRLFPSRRTTMNCKGEVAVSPTLVAPHQLKDIGGSWAIMVGTMLTMLAEAKDEIGYSIKFEDIVDKFGEGMQNTDITVDAVRRNLMSIKQTLERLE